MCLLQEPLTPVPAHRGPGPGPVTQSTGTQSPPSITPIHIHQVSDHLHISDSRDSCGDQAFVDLDLDLIGFCFVEL